MIAALNNTTNTTTLNGPGASTGQSARVRDADVYDPSTSAAASTATQAEASAVVSLSPEAASLAASGAQAPTVTAQPAAASARQVQTQTPAPAQISTATSAQTPAPAPAAPTTVSAQSTSFQPSNARAAVVSTEEKFPEPISLVPNLVYAEADSDMNGVISPSERRAYDVLHPTLGQRAADVPPKRVVEAELREYTAIAKSQF